jgi:glycosyltransferase involved in cell wall biosynthesis
MLKEYPLNSANQTPVRTPNPSAQWTIAVLVPCYNEAHTIGQVVTEFHSVLPIAKVYVYDNGSTDDTAAIAAAAGATVRKELRRGKGNVIRRMFADVDADIFLLVDGDGTYDAAAAPALIEKLTTNWLDFVNGARIAADRHSFPSGHRFGNWMLSHLIRWIFGSQFNDMLSGYKALSRRFVKSFPAMSRGFETETELAVHALELRMPCGEEQTSYRQRPDGSESKLRTFRDGARILMIILRLVKDERPLQFFAFMSLLLFVAAGVLITPIIFTYIETGLVPRFPTAILALGLVIIGTLNFFAGLILDMTTRTRQELKRLVYLSLSGPKELPKDVTNVMTTETMAR